MYRQAFGGPFEERIKLAREIWLIAVEEVWTLGTVGLSPGMPGVRVAKTPWAPFRPGSGGAP